MADVKHIIEPERMGLWVAATFVIALLALVMAIIGLTRSHDLMYMTQVEAMLLNKKIGDVKQAGNAPATPAQPAQQEQK